MSNIVQLFSPQTPDEPRRMSLDQSAQMYADAHRVLDEGMSVSADLTATTSDCALVRAIAHYRASWQAFQNAPDGLETRLAERAETDAFWKVLSIVPQSESDLTEIIEFLTWYTIEEAQRFGAGPCDDLPFAYLAALNLASNKGPQPS